METNIFDILLGITRLNFMWVWKCNMFFPLLAEGTASGWWVSLSLSWVSSLSSNSLICILTPLKNSKKTLSRKSIAPQRVRKSMVSFESVDCLERYCVFLFQIVVLRCCCKNKNRLNNWNCGLLLASCQMRGTQELYSSQTDTKAHPIGLLNYLSFSQGGFRLNRFWMGMQLRRTLHHAGVTAHVFSSRN